MNNLKDLLLEIDNLKSFIQQNANIKIHKSFDEHFRLDYTYNSNAIEGNTLTIQETKLVVLDGITIGGKSMREHFEAINHHEAILYIEELAKNKEPFSEYQIKSLHSLILKNIDNQNAGKYRDVNVKVSASTLKPTEPYLIPAEMEKFVNWYHNEAVKMHPILRASQVHIDFVTIHPFIDGNGRTARLLMNLELIKSGLMPINIKYADRTKYYDSLELSHKNNDKSAFNNLVAQYCLDTLKERKDLIQQEIKNLEHTKEVAKQANNAKPKKQMGRGGR